MPYFNLGLSFFWFLSPWSGKQIFKNLFQVSLIHSVHLEYFSKKKKKKDRSHTTVIQILCFTVAPVPGLLLFCAPPAGLTGSLPAAQYVHSSTSCPLKHQDTVLTKLSDNHWQSRAAASFCCCDAFHGSQRQKWEVNCWWSHTKVC